MAAGQVAFSVAADVAALDALAEELAVQELSRGASHVGQLRTLLRMLAVGRASGMELGTVAHAALALGCSEHRANRLLTEAVALGELPGALEAVECGLLTVEQSATVGEQLAPLPFAARRAVWARLQRRLLDDGSPLPPARLAELLRRWVLAADPDEARQRRRQAEDRRRVDYRRRADGLGDLCALGFTGPDLQAVLSRIRDRAHPVGHDDRRTADQRRFDAVKDLLLGRDPLPLHDPHDPQDPHESCSAAPRGGGQAPCGCWPGSPVPCGIDTLVHMALGTGLGTSDEPAELVGHGPLEGDLLQQVLLAGPRLRPVWTDEHGVVLAVGDQVVVPERDDPASLRAALLHLAALPPPPVLHPRHPNDHPDDPPPGMRRRDGHEPAARSDLLPGRPPLTAPAPVAPALIAPARVAPAPVAPARAALAAGDAARLAAAALTAPGDHPADTPGAYRVPRRLRRLIEVRSPWCEWPGCGARAVHCDAEHDQAWPDGPTCACNLGPCCRRHHRIKQLGWTKTRHTGGLTWTSPGRARTWLRPAQHPPPTPPVRPLPALPAEHPLAELSPLQQQEELWWLAECPDDLDGLELRTVTEPSVRDTLGELLRSGDTTWSLDLDDPHAWQEQPEPVSA